MPLVRNMIRAAAMAAALLAFQPQAAPSSSREAQAVAAPPALEQWRGWIEQRNIARDCPGQARAACVWLGALDLTEGVQGWRGHFAAANLMAQEIKMRLPGGEGAWPTAATIDGGAAAIGKDGEGPYVMLAAHRRGEIAFIFSLERSSSSSLAIPSGFPMASIVFANGESRRVDASQPVDLSRHVAAASSPPGPGDLAQAARGQEAADRPIVRVSRLIQDAQVPTMATRVRIENGGQRRLVTIDGIVPEGATVFDMRAPGGQLTERSLSIEAPPGVSILSLTSAIDPGLGIKWGKVSSPNSQMADSQYVFIQSNESFRKVAAQGAAIDPKTIDASLSFGALPAYSMDLDGSGLTLSPKPIERQGDDSSAEVKSDAWLGFDGSEVFMLERMKFLKSAQGWFEPVGGWMATQATANEGAVVVAKKEKGDGGRIATAVGMDRLQVGMSEPASLWLSLPAIASEGIVAKSAVVNLHLPLGWRALGVFGAGQSDAGWMASLSLWDCFLMIVAVWVAKSLFGWRMAGTLLAAMIFGRLFLGAPFAIYLPLLAALALARHLPSGGFKTAALVAVTLFMAGLLAQAAPYTMSRIQKTLHASLDDWAQPGADQRAAGMWRRERSPGVQDAAMDSDVSKPGAPPGAPNGQGEAMADSAPEAADQATAEPKAIAAGSLRRQAPSMAKDAMKSIAAGAMDASPRMATRAAPDASGAQAGQGVPSWRAGISVPIVYPAPATAGSVARVLLMPAWMAKMASLASLLGMWMTLVAMAKLLWSLASQTRRDAVAVAAAMAASAAAALAAAEKARLEAIPSPGPAPGEAQQGENA